MHAVIRAFLFSVASDGNMLLIKLHTRIGRRKKNMWKCKNAMKTSPFRLETHPINGIRIDAYAECFSCFFFRSLSLLALNPVAVDDRHSQFATAARAKCAAQQKKEERNNAIHDLQSYRKDHCAVCSWRHRGKWTESLWRVAVHIGAYVCVCEESSSSGNGAFTSMLHKNKKCSVVSLSVWLCVCVRCVHTFCYLIQPSDTIQSERCQPPRPPQHSEYLYIYIGLYI